PVHVVDDAASSSKAHPPSANSKPSAKVAKDGTITYDLRSWAALQRQDLTLGQVISTLEGKTLSAPLSQKAQGLLALKLYIDELGVLRYDYKAAGAPRPLILVPFIFQIGILLFYHQTFGCVNRDETIRQAMRHVYFSNMHDAYKAMKDQCKPCQLKAGPLKPNDFLLISHRYISPFHSLSLDHIGPLYPEIDGYKYILACKCLFSNWIELLPCRTTSAQEVTKLLTSEVFSRYSLPACIIADRGSAFTSQEMVEMCHLMGIELRFTSAFNHRANPVERSNQDWKSRTTSYMRQSELVNGKGQHTCHLCGFQLPNAKSLLSHLRNQHEPEEEPPPLVDADVKTDVREALKEAETTHQSNNWVKLLPAVLFTMRTAVSRTRGASPFQIIFGRDPTSSLDLLFGGMHHRKSKFKGDGNRYLLVRSRQEEAADLFARTNLQNAINRRREDYTGALRSFNPGDKVYLFTPRATKDLSRKFHHYWSGPFLIKEKVAPTTYKVIPAPGVFPRKIDPITTQVDRLKVYTESDDIITPPADLHLGIQPNNEAAAFLDPAHFLDRAAADLIQVEDTLPPEAPWEPKKSDAPPPNATRKRTKAKAAAAPPPVDTAAPPTKTIKRSLPDYPAIALGRRANSFKKKEFSQLPIPMRTRGSTRRQAATEAAQQPPSVAALNTTAATPPPPHTDEDLAALYDSDVDFMDSPDRDPSYYHRLAALDASTDDDDVLKHMIRGEAYIGLTPISAFSVTYSPAGKRSLALLE
ncbi:MAG: transposase family protein, partial [Pirellulales bacterium]|nr:transposase family protein [Pirellulales bacterium]